METRPPIRLASLYREHFDFVWGVLSRLGVEARDLDDVVQEVFLVVHRRLGAFEGRSSIKTWLYAIAVRVAMNHVRRRRRRPLHALVVPTVPAPGPSADPEERVARLEAAELLFELLDRLEPKKRAVFVLSEIEELPAAEIGRIVGANPRTVYSRLRAARHAFATELRRRHARDDYLVVRARMRRAAAEQRPEAQRRKAAWAGLLLRIPRARGLGAVPVGAWTLAGCAAAMGLGAALAALPAPGRAISPATSARPPATEPDVDVAAAPAVTEPAQTTVELIPDAIARSSPSERRPRRGSPRPHPNVRPDSSVDRLAMEIELLARARHALARGELARALDELTRHAESHPDGALAKDRQRTMGTVLCRMGRPEDARRASGDPTLRCEGIGE